ncbi:phage tail family protein [Enterococcus casseliflavus]|uniref:distal tail protein Dit n=1 Tax=Enterococcus casseliflavus TaxID=37734 RepID=UPI00288EE7E5|nr:distal tail protein Dit [Enterococcus casseliflavus]MDT2954251.1 phage tail family protein [Enterococcus casseliflavus]MDT2957521.1 phage tail family protein [Enterococcus casseliflavus]
MNNMYPFMDTHKNERYIPEYIPTSAMYYDGVLLEGVIEGYQTLSVTGREMLSVNIESESIQLGSLVTNQTLPSRTLTVKYKLVDKDPEKLQKKFDKLMHYLIRYEDVPIKFNDELDFTYYGRYSASEVPPGDTNSIVSSFDIYCADPRKYTKQYISNGEIATYIPYTIVPDVVRVKLSAPTSVKVTNGSLSMSITGASIVAGDVVEFRNKEGSVYVNGVDKTNILDWAGGQLEDFYIKKGDVVKTNNGSLEVFYRVVAL